jgi:hypothetical protein
MKRVINKRTCESCRLSEKADDEVVEKGEQWEVVYCTLNKYWIGWNRTRACWVRENGKSKKQKKMYTL